MNKTKLVLCLLAVLLSLCLIADITFAAGETPDQPITISLVRTAGNRAVSNSEVLAAVRSRAGQVFDADTAAEDAKRISNIEGVESSYYNKEIVNGQLQLTFVVIEKDIVRSIEFIGNKKFKAATLRKKSGIKKADYLDELQAQNGRQALIDYYHKKGFPFVNVTVDNDQLRYGKLIYRIEEGPRPKIVAVRFTGNEALTSKQLQSAIKTKKKKLLILQQYLVESKVQADITKLQNAYYERGYLDAQITSMPQFNDDKSKVTVVFGINEGRQYTVNSVGVNGNTFFDYKVLTEKLKLVKGKVYNVHKADSDVKAIHKRYREAGFVESNVAKNVNFVGTDRVDVVYDVTEGERFRIGQINITGNEQTQDKVVRHVLDEYDFQPGYWYNADLARGDGTGYLETLVRRSAYSKSATITPSGDTPGQRDAQVSITEGQTGSVMLGAGVSTDDGLIGQLIYEQRNFDIADTPDSFSEFITGKAFKGAGQMLRIALEPGTEVSTYSISFTEPYFMDKPTSLNVGALSYMRGRETYDEERLKGYFGFEKRMKNRWRPSINFRGERVDVKDVDLDAPIEIKETEGQNTLYGVGVGLGRDMTNDIYNPSKGYSFNLGYEQVAGDYKFGVLSGTHRTYHTLYEDLAEKKTILATKLYGATILGDAPAFEKFYAGGQGSLRGFEYRGVSTRGINTVTGKLDQPIGSDWIVLANTEVLVPLMSENFALIFFCDSGTVDQGPYRVSVGTGVQILLPQWFGPVPMRFELGAPLLKDELDESQFFSFSVGRLF